jgi:hypothetical protein
MKDKIHYILVGLAIVVLVVACCKKSGFENQPDLSVKVYSDYIPGKKKAIIKNDYIVKENQEMSPKYRVKSDNTVVYFKDSEGTPINQDQMDRLYDIYSHCYPSVQFPNIRYCIKDKI